MPDGAPRAFAGNPLSLSLRAHDFNAWVAETSRATQGNARGDGREGVDGRQAPSSSARARGDRAMKPVYKTLTMTVDDLGKAPKAWREFLCLDSATSSYGRPKDVEDAKRRLDGNVYEFIGNYIRAGVVIVCAVLYERPSAVVGLLATAKMYAWMESNVAATTETWHQMIRMVITAAAWFVMMYTKASAALSLSLLCTVAFTCAHGCFRRRDAPKPVKMGRYIGHGLKWEIQSPKKSR